MELASSGEFDLILLDLMLPGMSGFDMLNNLRSFGIATPAIIISALSGTEHVVKGLDLGAIDYIRKPFEWEELLARIRVIQKKNTGNLTSIIEIEDLKIDLIGRKVTMRDLDLKLTNKEFALLEYLAAHPNKVISKNRLMESVWQIDFDPGSNIVEVHMYQLRKKMTKISETPAIETVVGMGYSLKGEKAVKN